MQQTLLDVFDKDLIKREFKKFYKEQIELYGAWVEDCETAPAIKEIAYKAFYAGVKYEQNKVVPIPDTRL